MAQAARKQTSGPDLSAMDREQWPHMYEQMAKIRVFEEHVNELYQTRRCRDWHTCISAQEAVAVGVCEALRRDDYITSTHRGHGHCLAKGASLDRMFAELLGKAAATAGAKAARCTSPTRRPAIWARMPSSAAARASPPARPVGQNAGSDQVAVCFFGEGALGQGLLYEVMNMASLWKLPVIYVCENNLYNEYTHYTETTAGDFASRAAAFRHSYRNVDGQDVRLVHLNATASWSSAPAAAKDRPSWLQHLPLPTAITSATSTALTIARKKKKKIGRQPRPAEACWLSG